MYFSPSSSPPSTSYTNSTPATPMQIPSSSSSASSPSTSTYPFASRSRSDSFSCAFPSWPRRASLESNNSNSSLEDDSAPVTSYISDDDLLFPGAFDDLPACVPISSSAVAAAVAAASRFPRSYAQYSDRSPFAATVAAPPPPAQLVLADTGAIMRQLIAEEKAKRELRKRRGSRGSRKSRSGSSSATTAGKVMTPIKETCE